MSSLNKVHLIGHLGRDPEVRYTPSGDAQVILSLATTETWRDKATGEKKSATEWHKIISYGKGAEGFAKYAKKGTLAYAEGKLRTKSYEKDGVTRYSTEVVASTLTLLGESTKGATSDAQHGKAGSATPAGDGFDEEIPF